MENERAIIGSNSGEHSGFTLPADNAEAARWIFERYKHLKNQRRWAQTTITALIKDAKAQGHDPAKTRMAVRLGKMTPEQRKTWEETTAAAAALFGIKMEYSDEEIDREDPIWPVVEKAKAMHDEKANIAALMKELWETAREGGFEPEHFKLISALDDKNRAGEDEDDTEVSEEWFIKLDSLGTKLGFW